MLENKVGFPNKMDPTIFLEISENVYDEISEVYHSVYDCASGPLHEVRDQLYDTMSASVLHDKKHPAVSLGVLTWMSNYFGWMRWHLTNFKDFVTTGLRS